MSRTWILIVMALPVLAFAQTQPRVPPPAGGLAPYAQPVVAQPSMSSNGGWGGGGYYGGGGGGATVDSANMNGMANVISAGGEAALNRSAAAVNMTQAESNQIQNRQAATDAYFSMRAVNREATAAEAGPRLTNAQMTSIAQQGVPKPLGPTQMDQASGKLIWPAFLQTDPFTPRRTAVDELVAKEVYMGALSYPDQAKVRDLIKAMHEELKTQINNIPTSDYISSRTFLNSLAWAITKSQI